MIFEISKYLHFIHPTSFSKIVFFESAVFISLVRGRSLGHYYRHEKRCGDHHYYKSIYQLLNRLGEGTAGHAQKRLIKALQNDVVDWIKSEGSNSITNATI